MTMLSGRGQLFVPLVYACSPFGMLYNVEVYGPPDLLGSILKPYVPQLYVPQPYVPSPSSMFPFY